MARPRSGLEAQGALLLRAAAFLGAPATLVKPDRVIGNSLRELDLFLTDLIAEAVWLTEAEHRPLRRIPDRRIYSAAEAWRRACLDPAHYPALKRIRADQNRLAFTPPVADRAPSPFALGDACIFYMNLAQHVLEGHLPLTRALRAA